MIGIGFGLWPASGRNFLRLAVIVLSKSSNPRHGHSHPSYKVSSCSSASFVKNQRPVKQIFDVPRDMTPPPRPTGLR